MKVAIEHDGQTLRFRCPGCGNDHVLYLKGGHGSQWHWDGSLTFPTVQPSVLNTWGTCADPNWKEPEEKRYMVR